MTQRQRLRKVPRWIARLRHGPWRSYLVAITIPDDPDAPREDTYV